MPPTFFVRQKMFSYERSARKVGWEKKQRALPAFSQTIFSFDESGAPLFLLSTFPEFSFPDFPYYRILRVSL